jgi:hypothetical protein
MTPDERRRAVDMLDGMVQSTRLVLGVTQEKALRDQWRTGRQDPLCGALENVDRALEVAANYLSRIKEDQ